MVATPTEYGLAAVEEGRTYAFAAELLGPLLSTDGVRLRYPAQALRKGQKGLVVVRIALDPDARIQSVDFLCRAPAFDQTVADAVAATLFRPALTAQGRVASWMLLEFAFLADSGGESDADVAERVLGEMQRACLQLRAGG